MLVFNIHDLKKEPFRIRLPNYEMMYTNIRFITCLKRKRGKSIITRFDLDKKTKARMIIEKKDSYLRNIFVVCDTPDYANVYKINSEFTELNPWNIGFSKNFYVIDAFYKYLPFYALHVKNVETRDWYTSIYSKEGKELFIIKDTKNGSPCGDKNSRIYYFSSENNVCYLNVIDFTNTQ